MRLADNLLLFKPPDAPTTFYALIHPLSSIQAYRAERLLHLSPSLFLRIRVIMTECKVGNDYNGHMAARISSIFVILVGSLLGTHWNHAFA
jgi:hypothetical protein